MPPLDGANLSRIANAPGPDPAGPFTLTPKVIRKPDERAASTAAAPAAGADGERIQSTATAPGNNAIGKNGLRLFLFMAASQLAPLRRGRDIPLY